MGIQSQSTLIAAMILVGLAVHVYNDRRSIKFRKTFVVLLASLSLVNAVWFVYLVSKNANWLIPLSFGALFFAQVISRFFQRFTRSQFVRVQVSLNLISFLWVLVLLTDTLTGTRFLLHPSVLSVIGFSCLSTYAYCIWRLFLQRRNAHPKTEAARIGYLVIGGVITLTLTVFDILASMDYGVPAIGHLSFTIYMYFWMQIVLRSRLMDLKEVLGRGLSMLSLSTLVTIIYIMMLAWVGNRSELLLFNTFAASVLVFFTFEPLKQFTDTLVNRLLFRPTFALMTQLRSLRQRLRATMTPAELSQVVLGALVESRRFTHVSLFVIGGTELNFKCLGTEGPIHSKRISRDQDHLFLDQLFSERILSTDRLQEALYDLSDSIEDSAQRTVIEHVIATMGRLNANVSFALVSDKRLIGILNVADQRSLEPFSSVEIERISNAALSISAAFANSESVQKIRDQERLSAVGEMATGMAHEIRNPLGAIKSAAQLLTPDTQDSDSDAMLQIIIDEANRLDMVLSDFLLFARPSQADLGEVDIVELIERINKLVEAELTNTQLSLKTTGKIPIVLGHRDQLHQVCLNLLRNAIQASNEAAAEVEVHVELVRERVLNTERQRVQVTFIDKGPGIPQSDLNKLFVPFFTTKQSGTGLGLAISQRILAHHGTKINVWSEIGVGTRMAFRLFRFEDGVRHTSETQLTPPNWNAT